MLKRAIEILENPRKFLTTLINGVTALTGLSTLFFFISYIAPNVIIKIFKSLIFEGDTNKIASYYFAAIFAPSLALSIYLFTKQERITSERMQGPEDFPQAASKYVDLIRKKLLNNQPISIKILAHTGKTSVNRLVDALDQLRIDGNFIKILLRDPNMEEMPRHLAQQQVEAHLRKKNIQFRYYSSAPAFNMIETQLYFGQVISLISFYSKQPNGRSKISEVADLQKGSDATNYIWAKNWFDYHWGKSEYSKIHTLAFDFDDTIADTAHAQISAWTQAIIKTRNQDREPNIAFIDEIYDMSPGQIGALLRKYFIEKQNSHDIAEALIKKSLKKQIRQDMMSRLEATRFDIRRRLTLQCELFPGCAEALRDLSKDYYLCLITATEENVAESFLGQHQLSDLFSYVYGKHTSDLSWSASIHRKANNIIKISASLGVPLSRIVYIGDSMSDYEAMRQVSVAFIEARLTKREIGDDSMIQSKEDRIYFSSYGDLRKAIVSVEKRIGS